MPGTVPTLDTIKGNLTVLEDNIDFALAKNSFSANYTPQGSDSSIRTSFETDKLTEKRGVLLVTSKPATECILDDAKALLEARADTKLVDFASKLDALAKRCEKRMDKLRGKINSDEVCNQKYKMLDYLRDQLSRASQGYVASHESKIKECTRTFSGMFSDKATSAQVTAGWFGPSAAKGTLKPLRALIANPSKYTPHQARAIIHKVEADAQVLMDKYLREAGPGATTDSLKPPRNTKYQALERARAACKGLKGNVYTDQATTLAATPSSGSNSSASR
jgi:hypothetical protein